MAEVTPIVLVRKDERNEMRPMKVLHVVPRLRGEDGGVSGYVAEQCRALVDAGLQMGIAFLDVGSTAGQILAVERLGVRLHRFRPSRTRGNPILFSWDLVRRLERVCGDYDVIHIDADWLFPVWWAAHVARKLGKPYVMMPHGSFAPERLRRSRWKKFLVGWLDRSAARRASALWATDQSEAAAIHAYVPGVRVDVFPIGLEMSETKAREKVKGKGKARTLLFLSRISPIKGLDLLAEAWSRLHRQQTTDDRQPTANHWRLLIVGPDDRGYRAKIEKMFAEKCPTGSFEFRNPVYGAGKEALLSSADAFVLPTRNENWGIAVAEAMASGLPVICTKGAPWSCLNTEQAGWWTEVSVDGLERALRELMACSDDRLLTMGANARKWVVENLAWSDIGVRMRRAYETSVG